MNIFVGKDAGLLLATLVLVAQLSRLRPMCLFQCHNIVNQPGIELQAFSLIEPCLDYSANNFHMLSIWYWKVEDM